MRTSPQAISTLIESLSIKSPSFRNIRIPMSRMYIDDLIRLCELFHATIGRFTVELDTDRMAYNFDQDSYPAIRDIDRFERVEAMFISYHGESMYPILFMILSRSCASVNINYKYDIKFGVVDDAVAIAGKHKRALDIFRGVRPYAGVRPSAASINDA